MTESRVPLISVRDRGIVVLALIFVIVGVFLRFTHLERKIFWNDETYTALRVSGYTQGDLAAMYDGKVHTMGDIARLQHVNAQHTLRDTIHSLVTDDPQHPPLFYGAERIWAGVVGDAPARLRLLAALISLLAFPAMYWLCRELFVERTAGFIGMGLLAVSPFHLIYAHEAREYSLWAFTTLAASAMLLRATRRNTRGTWLGYAAFAALGLYGALLTVYTLAAHALFMAIMYRKNLRMLGAFALSLFGAGVAFSPWIYKILTHWNTLTSYMSWGNFRYPFMKMAQKWIFNGGAVLFDAEFSNLKLLPFALLGLAAVLAAIVYTIRFAPRRSVVFLVIIAGLTTGVFLVQDFRTGTYFSTIARYLTPLWLICDVALAFTLARLASAERPPLRIAATFAFAACLVASSVSSWINGSAEAWYNNNTNGAARKLAAALNNAVNPLLISSYKPDTILVLSHEVRPDVHVLLVPAHIPRDLPTGFANYALLSPSPAQENEATFSDRFVVGRRDYFDDTNSPIEQFHADLRKQQSAIGVKQRQTPQDFLVFLTERKAQSDEMFYHKRMRTRLAFNSAS